MSSLGLGCGGGCAIYFIFILAFILVYFYFYGSSGNRVEEQWILGRREGKTLLACLPSSWTELSLLLLLFFLLLRNVPHSR